QAGESVGFHIVPLEETEPGMFSLGLILSKNAPITVLHRYGMAVENPILAVFSKPYGSSDFHIPCSSFCLLYISTFYFDLRETVLPPLFPC
uniref:Uncharacterized protein n=1 Tax=Phasianus colchicus TaxID=9054 RepID=A0A669PGW8_PHACC